MADDRPVDKIEVFEGADGWHWHEVSNNGDILSSSQAYADKDNAKDTGGKVAEQLGVPLDVVDDYT